MPHRIPKTRTTIYYTTKEGIYFSTEAINKSFKTFGSIKAVDIQKKLGAQIGIGKKGSNIIDLSKISTSRDMRYIIEGSTKYKVYTATEGPYAIIPSVRKSYFFGIFNCLCQ